MKKYFALMLTILLLASIFITYIPVAASNPVTLRFSWWGDDTRHKATLEAIKLFEAKYPNIKIKPEYAGWTGYQDKQTTQIAGGTAADVMQINWNWLPEYSRDGNGFYDLNQVAKEVGLENFTKAMLDTGTVKGKLNAIPVALTGRVFYFNKTIYDKFGVPVPKTWNDLLYAPAKFAYGYYPIDLSAYDAWLLAMTYVEQRTGKQFISNDGKLVFTQDDIRVGLMFYKNLIDRKVAETIQVRTSEGGNSLTPVAQLPSFLDGKYAGIFEWTSAINKSASPLAEKKMEMVCGYLPKVAGFKDSGAIIKPSMMFAINKNCKYAKEAAMFLNFILSDPAGAKAMGTNRGIPVSKAGLEALKAGGQITGLEYEGIQYLIANPGVQLSPYTENAKLQSVYQQTIEQLSYGKLNVDGAAKYMYDNVQTVLKQIVK
ncbi:MAG TPA: ABC transporter substrate-binding protein [Clostridia bacterium]|nr:ABC transporter substrate-binding protein [Clostridia bacterium]